MPEEKDTKTIRIDEAKSITLLADARNIYHLPIKPGAKATVEIIITQKS